MTVYADLAFALNAAINYFLLLSSARLGGAGIRRGRMVLAAAAGGAYAVASLTPGLAALGSPPIKLASMLAMLLAAFGHEKRLLRLTGLFFAVSAAFAGLMLVLCQLSGTGLLLLGGSVFYPVSLTALLLGAAGAYALLYLTQRRRVRHTGEIREMKLCLEGRSVPVRALYDTGNTLRDSVTNEPVLIVHYPVLQKLLPDERLTQADFLAPSALLPRLMRLHPRLIAYRAVGTESGLLLALRCRVEEAGKPSGTVLAAFSPTPLAEDSEFDALTGGTE